MSSAPVATGVPRSTGVATTRPAISAATSACSSAVRLPVARMNRAIGCSMAATGSTCHGGGRRFRGLRAGGAGRTAAS